MREDLSCLERRQTPRESVLALIVLRLQQSPVPPWEAALLQDVSTTGLRLRTRLDLREGDVLTIRDPQKLPFQAEVVWIRMDGLIERRFTREGGQAYQVGCRIVSAPS